MDELLFLILGLFCIVIILLVMKYLKTSGDNQKSNQLFAHVLGLSVVFIIIETLWNMYVLKVFSINITIEYILNILYFIVLIGVTYSWFLYIENFLNRDLKRNKIIYCVSLMPLVIITILSLLSFKFNLLFSIDSNGIYSRGPLYFLQVILTMSYLFYSIYQTLREGLKPENYVNKSKYMANVYFGIIPLVFSILQVIIPGLPLLFIAITIGEVNVFLNYQQQLILNDPLTDMNNRNKMIRYLSLKMKNANHLFLFIMDLDNFKTINDKYGHIEGDNALKYVANVLKGAANKYNGFASRYGGDEFIVIIDDISENVAKSLEDDINKELKVCMFENNLKYNLQISVGFKEYDEVKDDSIPKYISKADNALYLVKKAKKNVNKR